MLSICIFGGYLFIFSLSTMTIFSFGLWEIVMKTSFQSWFSLLILHLFCLFVLTFFVVLDCVVFRFSLFCVSTWLGGSGFSVFRTSARVAWLGWYTLFICLFISTMLWSENQPHLLSILLSKSLTYFKSSALCPIFCDSFPIPLCVELLLRYQLSNFLFSPLVHFINRCLWVECSLMPMFVYLKLEQPTFAGVLHVGYYQRNTCRSYCLRLTLNYASICIFFYESYVVAIPDTLSVFLFALSSDIWTGLLKVGKHISRSQKLKNKIER